MGANVSSTETVKLPNPDYFPSKKVWQKYCAVNYSVVPFATKTYKEVVTADGIVKEPIYQLLGSYHERIPHRPVEGFLLRDSTTNRKQKITDHADKYELSKNAYVLVFHHYEFEDKRDNREGSMKDMEKIKGVLKNYRMDPLQLHSNCSVRSVRQVMNDVSKQDFSKNSCIIVFIMSHGGIQDTIVAHDGEWYSLQEDIVEKCTLNNSLKGKPKIFVIQACRGNAHMQTDSAQKVISDKSDIVIFQSTYEGTVSFRTMNGTFFMQEFLNLLQSSDSSVDVHEINMRLNAIFRKESISQTPTMTTTLQKRLFLNDLRS